MKFFQKVFVILVVPSFFFTINQKIFSQSKSVDGVLYPDIAMGEHGEFICVWVEERTGAHEILAQIYNSFGEKETNLIYVSDNTINWNVAPLTVFNKVTKEYLITWADEGNRIALQRLDNNGKKLSGNIKVNNLSLCNTNNPSVATDKFGNILVTWFSQIGGGCSGTYSAFVRMFDKEMNAISEQKTLFEDSERITSIGRDSRIASDTLGNFIVVWSGSNDGNSKIFLQKINANQWLFDKCIIVSDSLTGVFPTVSGTPDGYFLISWATEENGVGGRIFNSDSGFVSESFMIDENKTAWSPHSTSSDEFNNFYCGSRSWDSRLHKINKKGKIIDSLKLSNTSLKYSSMPKLSEVTNGELYAACYNYNNGDVDVRIGKFSSSLTHIGNDIVIEDECSSPEKNPKVKFNKDGNSIVVWEGKKDGYRNIYGQTFDKNFNPTSEEIIISDSSKYFSSYQPKISSDAHGNYIITFADEYNSYSNVFQKISSSGEKIANNIELSKYNEAPLIFNNSDKNNNTMFCWTSGGRNWNNEVYFKQYDSDLNSIGEAKLLFTGNNKKYISVRDIWIDKYLNIFILWNDNDITNDAYDQNLKALFFNKNGEVVSDTMLVNHGKENTEYGVAKCMKTENGDFIFVWIQWNTDSYDPQMVVSRKYRNNCKVYIDSININFSWSDINITKFNDEKSFISYNYNNVLTGYYFDDSQSKSLNVTLQEIDPYYHNPFSSSNNFSCDLYNDKLFFAYEIVNEKNRSFDIWANVQNFSDIYTEIKNVTSKTEEDEIIIYNPYPNPVLSLLTLQYEVHELACVWFAIYNSIGQVVQKIDSKVQSEGEYTLDIDVSNLSTGVYFIKGLNTKTNIKKFIVLK